MKKLSIITLFLFQTFSANAADSNSTRYEKIANMYNNGSLPPIEELNGWWSGRCFSEGKPNHAWAILLTFAHFNVNGDPGPALPEEKQTYISAINTEYGFYRNDAKKYDNLTQMDIDSVNYFIQNDLRVQDNPTFSNQGAWHSISKDRVIQVELRKSENYFVFSRFQSDSPNGFKHSYCYAFKNVYNP